jgi:hypothetical protein
MLLMKKLLLAALLISAAPLATADSSALKESMKDMVSGAVSSGKDAISGIKDGIEDGRKSGESIDGAIIITDKTSLLKYAAVSVQKVEKLSPTQYKLTVVFRNNSDKVVRLTNLNEQKSLQLLDQDGFVSYIGGPLKAVDSDVTIPEKAATRVRYEFSDVEGMPTTLRLYGMEVAVPPVSEAAK